MLKRIAMGIGLLLAMCGTAGCAAIVAGIDTDNAIKAAAEINLDNVQVLAMGRITEHDAAIAKLEALFEQRLGGTKGGAEAVKELGLYRTNLERLEDLKAADQVKISKVIENAGLLLSLIDNRIALRARWNALFGRIPAIGTIRDVAELKVRKYMEKINEGQPK